MTMYKCGIAPGVQTRSTIALPFEVVGEAILPLVSSGQGRNASIKRLIAFAAAAEYGTLALLRTSRLGVN